MDAWFFRVCHVKRALMSYSCEIKVLLPSCLESGNCVVFEFHEGVFWLVMPCFRQQVSSLHFGR